MAELDSNSTEKAKNKEAAQNAKSKSILESFEYIVELAEDSNLGKDFFDKAGKHIRYAARKLHLSPMQTVLLAMFVDRSEDSRIQISELARYAGCVRPKFSDSQKMWISWNQNIIFARHAVTIRLVTVYLVAHCRR